MQSAFEKVGTNQIKIVLTVGGEKLEEGLKYSYEKNRGKTRIPGFRPGKAPRFMIDRYYGRWFLMDDALNSVLPEFYESAVDELDVMPVSRPAFDLVDLEADSATVAATFFIWPETDVSSYKGIEYTKQDAAVTDEDVEFALNAELERNARLVDVTDRPVENGDTVIIDYLGETDDGPFEGGENHDYKLIIGSHSFVDTFEDQIIGLSIGEQRDVNVTFPEDYHSTELSGKAAVFHVTLKEIKGKEVPVADDEFAQDVSEFDTLEEYKVDLRSRVAAEKERQIKRDIEDEVIDKLVDNTTVELPEPMVDDEKNNILREFEHNLMMRGMTMEGYTDYYGVTAEDVKTQNDPQARRRVTAKLALLKVAEVENVQVSDEELDGELSKTAAVFKTTLEEIKQKMPKREIKVMSYDLKIKKALEIVVNEAIAADPPENDENNNLEEN